MMTQASPAEGRNSAPAPIAVLLGDSEVKIWGRTGAERLRRQLRTAGIVDAVTDVAAVHAHSGTVLLLHSGWVFDESLVVALSKAAPGSLLVDETSGCIVAALVDAASVAAVVPRIGAPAGALPAGQRLMTPATLAGSYNHRLRKREVPFLGALSEATAPEIERRTFAASYKGVTDLVTKYVWPWPARHVTRFCARVGITPNQVTMASLAFVIIAFFQFRDGHYATGLLAAWVMTFLDTVDGKLARVTLQSSKFGDIFDHGIDLIHPPFWWWAWLSGLGVAGFAFPEQHLVLMIVLVGYVAQRLEELVFKLLCGVGMHVWRPFDSFMRLITARRNPNLLILTVSVLLGRPDIGMQVVAAWVVICFVIHAICIVQGVIARRRGPLSSWLAG